MAWPDDNLGGGAQVWRHGRGEDLRGSPNPCGGEGGPGRMGGKERHRLAIQESPRFEAALLVEAYRWRGTHRLQLYTRPSHYGLVTPDRITIFRGPLTRYYATPEAIAEQVRKTVVHEIAHHFGMGEAQIASLGY